MFKKITLFLALILGLNSFTQSSFIKGYYINNSNEKINCLIKNVDWLNNPTEFKYKLSESSQQETQTINLVKEFVIINVAKYVRHNINIDRSSNVINEMGYDKNPIFKKEQLFLKVLIEGKANLYLYEDKGLVRYFFNKDLTEVKQLIFKNYLTDEGMVAKNNEFRRQLWNTLKCENISMDQLAKINYRQSELIKFFSKYNECINSEFVNYQKKQKRDLFNLTIRPGLRSSSLSIGNRNSRRNFDFDKGITSLRLGLEAELILGFNNSKWSLLIEPTYKNFKTEQTFNSIFTSDEEFFVAANQKALDLNFGVRYYISSNKKINIFTNIIGTYTKSFDSSITITSSIEGKSVEKLDITSGGNAAIGIGCKHRAGYSMELRYLPKHDLLNGLGAWGSQFSSVSILFGYTIF
ncbi:tRNA modification GTPase [Algibacter aquimarinus]|uniref:tRNA modification GTPase n=1 Tax=Algibacter aquimarinus TaxID=1136748 RepID=A0ABP9GYT8_9FLAO